MEDDKYTTLSWPWATQWEPLLRDAIHLAKKLEEFGFNYDNGIVVVTDQCKVGGHSP